MAKKETKELSLPNQIDLDKMVSVHDEISSKETSPLYVQKRQGPGGTTLDYVDEGYM